MEKRFMNKRGQTREWVIFIAVAVVVAILIILYNSGAFDKLRGLSEAVPEKLAAAALGCKTSVQLGSVSGFCYELKDVGNNEFVNCRDLRILDELRKEGVEAYSCTETLVASASIAQCKTLTNPSQWDNVKVNGKVCNTYTCTELGGTVSAGTCSEGATEIALSDSSKCCVVLS